MSKNSDPEYYNKEVKGVKVIVMKMYNKKKFGQPYQGGTETIIQGVAGSKK